MLLNEQRETPFDLRFRLLGVPIRVHPFFWLFTVFINFDLIHLGIDVLLLWVACVFVSILLHEFGHVWMGQVFGNRGRIVLQGMCGLAIGANGSRVRWQRIAVSLAGPGIQLLFAGFLFLGERYVWSTSELPRHLRLALSFLFHINYWWALINLLPIWPLDGGQVSRELFDWASPATGIRNSLALSLVTALVVTINALSLALGGPVLPYVPVGDRFFIFFFGMFAFESFMLLRIEAARSSRGWREPDEDRMPWETDPDEWKN